MIYCKEIQGTDWVFSVEYIVTCWGEPACRDYDEQPFRFEITSVTAAIDELGAVLMPATSWLIEQIEDDEQLTQEIEWDAHEWFLVDQDNKLEAEENRRLMSVA
jgi:hypothetical protein